MPNLAKYPICNYKIIRFVIISLTEDQWNSMLIYIFFVHVFDFFDIQLYELFDLFVDLVTLMGLRYMINQEERKESVIGNQTNKE